MCPLLHHSIDGWADRSPDHDAFRFEGARLTYAELVTRSNRLAHTLIHQGISVGDRVGIFMSKGLDLPVAVYGCFKAGAAYVPIDPTAPSARVQFIIEDCGIRHLVTNASRAGRLAPLVRDGSLIHTVVGLDTSPVADRATEFVSWADVESADACDPAVRVATDDLAYLMYTSGSTGAPKGLMHTHESGHSYATLSGREYDVRPTDRLGNHSPLHVDMSTFEYLTGPLCGATTVIVPEETTIFPLSLAALIESERLTFWYSVPLALIQLLDQGGLEHRNLGSLRWVLFGGEPFPPRQLARLMALLPNARFSNSYGPAEVNQCTAYHLPPGRVEPREPIPIGPIWSGARGLIVDAADRIVEDGGDGELLVHAPTMMRGYWARPDLNRRAFVERSINGQLLRFYRTGDLVRDRGDGTLIFLGRKDRQVKIRGYRVELEEVEAVLCELPAVVEAAAVALPAPDGALSIVAAVRLEDGADTDPGRMRRDAAGQLPGYAVPSRIDIVTAFPRTGGGKIDRQTIRATLEQAPG